MRYEANEPCLCGAIDCSRCYPNSWREAEYDEDEEEDRRDHDREDKEYFELNRMENRREK